MAGTHDTGPRGQRYAFGLQGKALRANISIAGALGFLLFGYDQGFLSVRLIQNQFFVLHSDSLTIDLHLGLNCGRELSETVQSSFIWLTGYDQRYLRVSESLKT